MSLSVSGVNVQAVSPSLSGLNVQSVTPSICDRNVHSVSPSVSGGSVPSVSQSLCGQSPASTLVATPMPSRQPPARAQSCKVYQHNAKSNNLQRANKKLKGNGYKGNVT